MKILVVEDNPVDQEIISANLSEHELYIVNSGESALGLQDYTPDLVLLDINLPGINGFETCKKLRESYCQVPIPVIFLTEMSGLEDRIKAFDAGGDDHISKPCDQRLLQSKIKVYEKLVRSIRTSSSRAESAFHALMDLQRQSAKIQSISRFVQASMFCHDLDSLMKLFLFTANNIGINCLLSINSNDVHLEGSTKNEISVLEREILEFSHQVDRIHQFGDQRAIYKWPNATLLALNVGDAIDILALFMDALSTAINSIETESRLICQVNKLEEENSRVSDEISDMLENMSEHLTETILSLGLMGSLDEDDQDKLNDTIDHFGGHIRNKLTALSANNADIQTLTEQLRIPPDSIKELIDNPKASDSSELF